MHRTGRLLSVLAALFALITVGRGQSVRWDPPGGQLGYNQVSQLSLVFEDCEPDGDPKLPVIDGLQVVGRPSQSSQTSIVNFKMSQTFSLIYPVRPNKRAPLTIPSFEIKTDKGTLKVPAARYGVGDAPVGNSGLSVDDIASATLETPRDTVWAGEVFPVSYTLDVVRRYFHSLGSYVQWPAAPAIADDWSKPDPNETILRGERRVISTQTTRATIKQPGTYALKPASQLVNILVGSSGFGLFSQPNVEQRQIDSKAVDVTVRPLPAAPPEFSGAVGTFTFSSRIVPLSAAVGEPITWTLELAGVGNWPDIAGLPQREVSNDFQVVQPKSKRTMKDGTLFEGSLSEDVVLVPTKAGTYQLPPVRFSYFDPKSGAYKTIATEPVTLTVTAAAAPVQPPANSGAPVQFSLNPAPAATTPALPTAAAPIPPENLPRDPLTTAASGRAPVPGRPLLFVCLAVALIPPVAAWLILAALRSRTRDPQLNRREAHAALGRVVRDLAATGPGGAATAALLVEWQHLTTRLWEIPHAAPGLPLVRTAIAGHHSDGVTAWSDLWLEADRALHGRDGRLPEDWSARAGEALRNSKVPGWNPISLFAPRNLFPLAVVALVLAFPPEGRAADAGHDAYHQGDFPAASRTWQAEVAATPSTWTARHNLGLALAQQDRWAEATGHWAGAALLAARALETRWDLALGLQRSGLAEPTLVELSRGEGAFRLAREASPGEWQALLVLAALIFATTLVLVLLHSFGRLSRWVTPVAIALALAAMLLAAAATFSLRTYGILAEPNVVFVWQATTLRSVPTEADTAQKTSPLSAGSLAVAEKPFLGWTKLTFGGGQSGWVRTETLIPLYR